MSTKITGLTSKKKLPAVTHKKINKVKMSITDFFKSFNTALRINTQTQIRIPPKAY